MLLQALHNERAFKPIGTVDTAGSARPQTPPIPRSGPPPGAPPPSNGHGAPADAAPVAAAACRDGRRDAIPVALRCVRSRVRGVARLAISVMRVRGGAAEDAAAVMGGSAAEGGAAGRSVWPGGAEEDVFCAYVHVSGRVRWGWLRGTPAEAQADRKAMMSARRAGLLDELFADAARARR